MIHLTVATFMVVLTVVTHGAGMAVLGRVLRIEAVEERAHHVPSISRRSLKFTILMTGALFFLHGLEIWLYALLYKLIGAIHSFETAIYFSTISYAGIGYDDRYIAASWRLVAAIEGINGLLLLGWSTAFFVTMVTRLGRV